MKIVTADREALHKELVALAKKSKYISSFSSIMFSSEDAYRKGWIRAAVDKNGKVQGFTCVRHKIRTPETMLYFITTDPQLEGKGIGQKLMLDLEKQSPHTRISLKVMLDNKRAIAFYEKLGYQVGGPAYNGTGVLMFKDWGQK